MGISRGGGELPARLQRNFNRATWSLPDAPRAALIGHAAACLYNGLPPGDDFHCAVMPVAGRFSGGPQAVGRFK
ncbi:MAG: hypothetical protein VB875_17280 [Pirellulales bacterium]